MQSRGRTWISQDILWELGASFIDATAPTSARVVENAIARIAEALDALSIGIWAIDPVTMSGTATHSWAADEWVALDDGYLALANAQTFALFDIERVEILKGPQGTLFGRNATGGLVHYHSVKPNFESMEGFLDYTYGIYDSDRFR